MVFVVILMVFQLSGFNSLSLVDFEMSLRFLSSCADLCCYDMISVTCGLFNLVTLQLF